MSFASHIAWLGSQLDASGAAPYQSADVYVEEYAVDAYGEQVATVALEKSGIPCHVKPMTAEMLERQGRDSSRRMSRIVFYAEPFPPDDARQRLIKIGDRTYRPVDALDLASAGAIWRCDCELVTG